MLTLTVATATLSVIVLTLTVATATLSVNMLTLTFANGTQHVDKDCNAECLHVKTNGVNWNAKCKNVIGKRLVLKR